MSVGTAYLPEWRIYRDEQTGRAVDIERVSYSLDELEDLARGAGPDILA